MRRVSKSLFMETFLDQFEKAKQEIVKLLTSEDIDFCFIGGMARNFYNDPRTTEDIDILVDIGDRDKMANLPIGYIRELSNGRLRVYSLHNPKTFIEVLYTGDVSGDVGGLIFPTPKSISKNHMITFENFLMYKISSGVYGKRMKDLADVQDSIRKYFLPETFGKDNGWPEDIIEEYKKIWRNT
jgi:hypothetical protein